MQMNLYYEAQQQPFRPTVCTFLNAGKHRHVCIDTLSKYVSLNSHSLNVVLWEPTQSHQEAKLTQTLISQRLSLHLCDLVEEFLFFRLFKDRHSVPDIQISQRASQHTHKHTHTHLLSHLHTSLQSFWTHTWLILDIISIKSFFRFSLIPLIFYSCSIIDTNLTPLPFRRHWARQQWNTCFPKVCHLHLTHTRVLITS